MRDSNRYITLFIVAVCVGCASILSILADVLREPQEKASKLYLSKQLLLSAKLIEPEQKLSQAQILNIYNSRVKPRLTNAKGDLFTFEQLNLDQDTYMEENAKGGYANLPNKLVYIIKEKDSDTPYGYVIPVNGYGLWDAIYGFICVAPDGDTVIGTTWYEQKETPGLGAEIATSKWQAQFPDKLIFQEGPSGATNFEAAKMGIRVVKTTVEQEIGNRPAAKSAVDGISGATKTSEGVSEAYQKSLTPYRQFLIRRQAS